MLVEEEASRAGEVGGGFLEEGADAGAEGSMSLNEKRIEQHSEVFSSSSPGIEAFPSSESWGVKAGGARPSHFQRNSLLETGWGEDHRVSPAHGRLVLAVSAFRSAVAVLCDNELTITGGM